jgi:hypothetical protein
MSLRALSNPRAEKSSIVPRVSGSRLAWRGACRRSVCGDRTMPMGFRVSAVTGTWTRDIDRVLAPFALHVHKSSPLGDHLCHTPSATATDGSGAEIRTGRTERLSSGWARSRSRAAADDRGRMPNYFNRTSAFRPWRLYGEVGRPPNGRGGPRHCRCQKSMGTQSSQEWSMGRKNFRALTYLL